ncbi:oxidoreductase [Niastella yeongjuensis]|uniref:Oxidoreductase n=1 Tax=Niastella yeongjuensis TaxID=354355 RepID=A0A1V9FCT4_9BACT|nr:MOSC N-terminal beta barrel domain-containing protein [Niastella yeongjuensis]OQP56097.1 oxidoreductase [Niastella yeongjuensis]
MLTVSELFIYPIKSLGGIALNSATLTDRGFEHDRRWMLVDDNNQFITQREVNAMALLKPALTEQGLLIRDSRTAGEELLVPFEPTVAGTTMVDVWGNHCRARRVSDEADAWFSKHLSISCKLMYMPDSTNRFVDGRYAHNKEITSFSDGYPLLLIGQASLDDLNNRLTDPLPMNRFRPNIVFTGGTAFQEDTMKQFEINGITFYCVKPCARCVMTTIDQQAGTKAKEPLKTLSTYRMKNNKILFGQNLLYNGIGKVSVGNTISIYEKGAVELLPD